RIKRRKKLYPKKNIQYNPRHKQVPTLFMDEEKHGIYLPNDDISDAQPIKTTEPKQRYRVFYQAIMSICLFIVCAILLNTSVSPSEKAPDRATAVLTDESPFAKIHRWYEETFGTPLAFTPRCPGQEGTTELVDTLSVEGDVLQPFSANGTGVMIGS